MKENIIQKRSFDFSLKIISLYKTLTSKAEFIISKQLLKSGTSIGANVEEAIAAQSKKDFLSKMSIASKEARETWYWLRLLLESNIVEIDLDEIVTESEEIVNILTSIVKSTQKSINELT